MYGSQCSPLRKPGPIAPPKLLPFKRVARSRTIRSRSAAPGSKLTPTATDSALGQKRSTSKSLGHPLFRDAPLSPAPRHHSDYPAPPRCTPGPLLGCVLLISSLYLEVANCDLKFRIHHDFNCPDSDPQSRIEDHRPAQSESDPRLRSCRTLWR